MPDSPPPPDPPRVHLTLPPGGGQVDARLTGWQQDEDGQWWATVEIRAPRSAVEQIPGQDYRGVPRGDAPPATGFVLDNSLPPGKDGRRLLLHTAGCPFIGAQKYRKRPLSVTADQARQELGRGGITTPCDACKPAP